MVNYFVGKNVVVISMFIFIVIFLWANQDINVFYIVR